MIPELIIVSFTVITLASLQLAKPLLKEKITQKALNEKRKILTEQKTIWLESWKICKSDPGKKEHSAYYWAHVEDIDKQLMKLADEDTE
jgi:hypothetical protein